MAGTTGIEPATSCVTGKHSNQLSYAPKPKLFNFQSHSGATQLANCVVKPLASAEPRQLSYAPKPKLFNFQRWKKQRLLSSIYANLFSCSSVRFKLDYTVNHSKQCIIRTSANIHAGVNFCTALSDKDIACKHIFIGKLFNA